MNTKQAKNTQIINYLQEINISPVRFSKNKVFYLSPFRNEKDASFKVDTNLNLWYDYGLGKGGNIIDLCMQLNKTDVKGALKIFSELNITNDFSFFNSKKIISETNIKINHIQSIQNKALIQYLTGRNIRLSTAKQHLKEVYYKVENKQYFALAFENDKKGFELRNKYFKGATSPKYYTTIKGTENNHLNIFEGVYDFLSALIYFNLEQTKNTTIILNSTANTSKVLKELKKYNTVFLFLDNDKTGIETAKTILNQHPKVINRAKIIYPKYKDFNEFICNKITKFGT